MNVSRSSINSKNNITSESVPKLYTDFKYNGFDSTMGDSWIYPINYPVQQYQYDISRVSLFKNTLVCHFLFTIN